MGMIIAEEDKVEWDPQDSSAQEEKIFVAVRLRPLNEREIARHDLSAWECINNTTILFKQAHIAYTFDRVYNSNCSTRQVYEEAAKRVALSVLSGMNSTIFAYGQTSSGKTYTMSRITDYTMADIYDFMDKHPERYFVLKFSAMEIYNESVKDLLCPYSAPLRLLDDPEKGTVVDKLTEVTLRDFDHLNELLKVCEAQRQTGETALNEVSSRSHQILRLTVESECREHFTAENSSTLTATVNFVDLAGSERASQTSAAGTRLKEGCHINRSLLSLGTVIRKLSKGRNGHVPYRDSKLTRILQNSLGGNARTAIICTMSPAQSLVEQSRNTLLFASCAKQVSTNAQVNVVMSEKELVKRLQNELARLENQLKNLTLLSSSSSSPSALKEKEEIIEKMDKEIRELTLQRDMAQSRLQSFLRSGATSEASKSSCDDISYEKGSSQEKFPASETNHLNKSDIGSGASHSRNISEDLIHSCIDAQFPECREELLLSSETSPTQFIDKYFGPDPCKGWEKITRETRSIADDNCREVQCIESESDQRDMFPSSASQETGDFVSGSSPCFSSENDASGRGRSVPRSQSCAAIISTFTNSSNDDTSQETESRVDNAEVDQAEPSPVGILVNQDNACAEDSRNDTRSDSMNEEEQTTNILMEECEDKKQETRSEECTEKQQEICCEECTDKQEEICSEECTDKQQETFVKDVNEVIEPMPEKQVECDLEKMVITTDSPQEAADSGSIETLDMKSPQEAAVCGSIETQDMKQTVLDWQAEYERQMREIIQLWDACHTPLVHRTYFFLLFKGDPSDAVYLEVELRRLSFLKNPKIGVGLTKDDPSFSPASRAKALNRERDMLSRRMLKKFSSKEREALYYKWGIDIKSKQRRVQLSRKLWTVTTNMEHISESAAIVAKLVGFKASGQEAPKEIFGLSFSIKPTNVRPFSWSHSLPSMI